MHLKKAFAISLSPPRRGGGEKIFIFSLSPPPPPPPPLLFPFPFPPPVFLVHFKFWQLLGSRPGKSSLQSDQVVIAAEASTYTFEVLWTSALVAAII